MSRNGGISKHGNEMTRKHLYEAATTMLTRTTTFYSLKARVSGSPKRLASKKARVGVARKLAVVLHAMWKTNTPFRWTAAA
jgi:transposase